VEPEARQSVRDIRPFTRCKECNELLDTASKEEVRSRIPPRIAAHCDEFQECARCKRVYWQGSHYRQMRRWIEELGTGSSLPCQSRAD